MTEPEKETAIAEEYDFEAVEDRWQRRWKEENRYHAEDFEGEASYVLSMFPYPSGNIHMGHVRNYSITDVISRIARKRGENAMHPIGYDSFGLPAEQAAIDREVHPAEFIDECIDSFEDDFRMMGFGFDWQRAFRTSSPEYYKWTQWVFLKLHEQGLVEKRESPVNWCPEHGVLANEEAEGGTCWRCGREVENRELSQWFVKTTEYADELLDGLDEIEDGWPDRVVAMQRNWIGRSTGARVKFELPYLNETLEVFTTRPDTLWGATFMVLAPEHPAVAKVAELNPDRADEILDYVEQAKQKSEREREAEDREKTGVDLGIEAVNPVNGEQIPVYVADYVLMDYGTGAIMAVPGHDVRDYEFARKHDIEVREVIAPPEGAEYEEPVYTGYGEMVDSGPLTGTSGEDAPRKVAEWLEEEDLGEPAVNYRLRDWLVSRQRYWGCPIPMVECDECGWVPETDLPVELPEDAPIESAKGSPLAEVEEFVATECPECGGAARRETDTMTTFVDSAWYFLRFCDPHNENQAFDPEKVGYWMPVDQYVGGVEHAVGHLIYARFITRVLKEAGLLEVEEPFPELFTQGMLTYPAYHSDELGWVPEEDVDTDEMVHRESGEPVEKDVLKMSKSKYNTVSPRNMVDQYGADTVRLFSLFGGPPDQDFEWQEGGVEGCHRFLNRIWRISRQFREQYAQVELADPAEVERGADELVDELLEERANVLEDVTEDAVHGMGYNTAIARLMELGNLLNSKRDQLEGGEARLRQSAWLATLRTLLSLLSPFSPHITEELWQHLGFDGRADEFAWEEPEDKWLEQQTVTLPVTVGGRPRAEIEVSPDAEEDEVREIALGEENVKNYIGDSEIQRFVYVPGEIVNVVLGD